MLASQRDHLRHLPDEATAGKASLAELNSQGTRRLLLPREARLSPACPHLVLPSEVTEHPGLCLIFLPLVLLGKKLKSDGQTCRLTVQDLLLTQPWHLDVSLCTSLSCALVASSERRRLPGGCGPITASDMLPETADSRHARCYACHHLSHKQCFLQHLAPLAKSFFAKQWALPIPSRCQEKGLNWDTQSTPLPGFPCCNFPNDRVGLSGKRGGQKGDLVLRSSPVL